MKKTALIVLTLAAFAATACGTGAVRPAATEFGLGPRTSAQGRYVATLEPASSLKARKMYTVAVSLKDAAGQPVEGATITVDGGMPEHGHGLPTQPRMTRANGNGVYEISGVRFNMGGWWELRLAISTPSGADTVTFNLEL